MNQICTPQEIPRSIATSSEQMSARLWQKVWPERAGPTRLHKAVQQCGLHALSRPPHSTSIHTTDHTIMIGTKADQP